MRRYLSLMILASTLIQQSYTRIGNLPWLWQSALQSQGTTKTRRENTQEKKVMTKETNEKSEKYLKIKKILNKTKNYNKNQFVPLNILLNNIY